MQTCAEMPGGNKGVAAGRRGTDEGKPVDGARPQAGPRLLERGIRQRPEERVRELEQPLDRLRRRDLFEARILDGRAHQQPAIVARHEIFEADVHDPREHLLGQPQERDLAADRPCFDMKTERFSEMARPGTGRKAVAVGPHRVGRCPSFTAGDANDLDPAVGHVDRPHGGG